MPDITTWAQAREAYDDALDEQGDVQIGSLTYAPSRVLALVDPIAYRCGMVDWLDSQGIDSGTLTGNDD